MAVIDITRSLFAGTHELTLVGTATTGTGGTRVGFAGPSGKYLSAAHAKATRSSSYNKAKLNYACAVLEKVLVGRVAALEGDDASRVYTEYVRSDGGIEQCLMTPTRIYWKPDIPTQSSHICVPFVVYAMQEASPMVETKAAFNKCAEDYYRDGKISLANAFTFCDAFYYEWKEHYPATIDTDNFLNEEIVKQAIRTGALKTASMFEALRDVPEVRIEAMPAASAAATTAVGAVQFDACKKGDYVLDYAWEPERLDHIPTLASLDKFVPNDTFYALTNLINAELNTVLDRVRSGHCGTDAIGDNYVNAIMVGKPGTGKTTLANALAATFGMPIYVVKADGNTESDTFEGMTKVAEGGFRFVPTPFLEVYKNGGIILLEEFNLANQAVLMGTLGQAIEKPFILYEDGYKEVRRHPLCIILSTMNSGTEGSRLPNQAFTSRSPDVFMLDDPSEDDFIAILQRDYSAKNCRAVYRAYSKIVAYLNSSAVNAQDIALAVTMRHCLAALRQVERCGVKLKTAIRNTMIGAIAIFNLPLATMTYDAVVEPMRD